MALAFISRNSDIADEVPLTPEQKTLKKLKDDLESRTLGAYSTKQVVNSTVGYKFNLQAVPFKESGGAVTPVSFSQFTAGSFAPLDPALKKLSQVNSLQYTYDFSFYDELFGVPTFPPTGNFTVPVYLTLGIARYNYFRTLTGTKYSVINSFKIGDLDWQNSAPVSFRLLGNDGSENVRGRVDWTKPVDNRNVLSSASGVIVRDFTNTDPTKLTKVEKQDLLNGSLSTLFVVVCVDTSALAAQDQNYMAVDVSPAFTFYGSITFDFFGLGTAYTPLV